MSEFISKEDLLIKLGEPKLYKHTTGLFVATDAVLFLNAGMPELLVSAYPAPTNFRVLLHIARPWGLLTMTWQQLASKTRVTLFSREPSDDRFGTLVKEARRARPLIIVGDHTLIHYSNDTGGDIGSRRFTLNVSSDRVDEMVILPGQSRETRELSTLLDEEFNRRQQ